MSDKVLFVDDESSVLKSIERLFIDYDMRILKATNADEALNILSNEEIAVIVSDNCMPGMNGVELLSHIKERSPDTMKILLTAHAELGVAVDAINEGEVFRFIIKPWDNICLVTTVKDAVKRYQIVQSLKHSDESTFLSLAHAIELKDPYTRGHCERVADYAMMIAKELNIPEETERVMRSGCWLHDCGKIGVPEKILIKDSTLTETEFEIVKKHPDWGAEVAKQANLSQTVINIILYHHERYDGAGYPSRIKGTEIPLEARIATVADVYDALTSNRAYRKKFCDDKAIKIMLKMKEHVFDPEITDIFFYKCLKINKDHLDALSNDCYNESS